MKNSLKTTILTFAGACFLFQACDTSVTRVTYVPDHDGVSFVQSSISDTEIDASAETWTFGIARARAESDLTVDLTASNALQDIVASSVTFTAGEYTAQISVDVSGLEIGTNVSGTVSITAGQAVCDTNTAITSVSLSLQKAYNWMSLGTGQWNDYFFLSDILEVEVAQAEGFDIYRVYDPWPTSAVLDENDEDSWYGYLTAGSVPSYLEFTVNDDGSISWGNTTYGSYSVIATGYTYTAAGYGEIYFFPPTSLGLTGDSYVDSTADGTVFVITWAPYIPSDSIWWGRTYSASLALPD